MECPKCLKENPAENTFCGACGALLRESILTQKEEERIIAEERLRERVRQEVSSRRRKPLLAALLSFFVVGLGQIYNRELLRGIFLFTIFILSFTFFCSLSALYLLKGEGKLPPFVGILAMSAGFVWIYGVADAYIKAKKFEGERSRMQLKPKWIFPIILAELIILVLLNLTFGLVLERIGWEDSGKRILQMER
jgi:TM2 domain-containing membrane protein YozV